jgi:hypothetical protein
MNETINISIGSIIWICAGVTTIITAIKAIQSINPLRKSKERFDAIDAKLAMDKKRLDAKESTDKIICKALLAILNHEITGNSIEGMKTTRDELQKNLIER